MVLLHLNTGKMGMCNMTEEQRLINLNVPKGKIDVILDTDAYNEIDDQFALSYLLKSKERFLCKAIYSAPFLNDRSTSPKEGMEKSYDEILKLLKLCKEDIEVFKGSEKYLDDEKTPVISPASLDLSKRALNYSPEKPLYVVAIGAITNIASAILINPEIANNIVIVWLGGHSHHWHDTLEFNMRQDIASAKVILNSKAPFIQLPCMGVVSAFSVSEADLRANLIGKTALCDYLCKSTIDEANTYAFGTAWSRVIWDVTAVAFLLNDDDRFMLSKIIPTPDVNYDGKYVMRENSHLMRYVYHIDRDALFNDLIKKLTNG